MSELNDSFSNPLAPPGHVVVDAAGKNLTNEDFRKLVMTVGRDPRATSSVVSANTTKEKRPVVDAEKKKKKKQQYLKFKKDKEERERELIAKYRDRARERRDGVNQDYEDVELLQATADYRAVAPDAKRQEELKERRKKAIDESKYLGGDMQHTHLVKGLDYALLDKVRQELTTKKKQEDIEQEQFRQQLKKQDDEINAINNVIARNIVRLVFGSGSESAEKRASLREQFSAQRMAYVVELDDDLHAETDIPTTVMRSVAESGHVSGSASGNGSSGPSSSEMVVEKLTEILAYLRAGKGRSRTFRKGEAGPVAGSSSLPSVPSVLPSQQRGFPPSTSGTSSKPNNKASAAEKIYDEVGDYVPPTQTASSSKAQSSATGGSSKRAYFGKTTVESRDQDKPQSVSEIMKGFQTEAMAFDADGVTGEIGGQNTAAGARIMKKLEQKLAVDSYAECYPGMVEAMDTLADSDDEADLSKMDMGTKKGPLNRWDFETSDEFEKYKSSQEALPKAAFQYGVKTNDGRKTRRVPEKKDDKGALEREWKQIQQIWERKRDSTGGGGGGGGGAGEEGVDDDDGSKRPRK